MGRRSAVVGLLVMVLVLLAGPIASACVTDDWIRIDDVAGAGPGSPLVVEGGGLTPGTAEIRWNGMSGEVLAAAEVADDGRFSATVVVPDGAVAGRSSVVVVQEPEQGGTRGWAYADLVLTAPLPPVQGVAQVTPGGSSPWPYLATTLLISAAGWLLVRARRRSGAEAQLSAELDRLVEEERVPVHTRSV